MSNSAALLIPPPADVDDTHKVYSIAIAIGILCAVTTVTGLARLLFRWRSDALGLEDYAFIPALVSPSSREGHAPVKYTAPYLTNPISLLRYSTGAGLPWPYTSTFMLVWENHYEKSRWENILSGFRYVHCEARSTQASHLAFGLLDSSLVDGC